MLIITILAHPNNKSNFFSVQFSMAESLRDILTTIPKDWTIDMDPLSLL